MEELITGNGFIEKMRESLWGNMEDEEALRRGLITDLDRLHGEKAIRRSQAARIAHHTLLYRGEPDEADWSAARGLKDLYSCSTCVNHIAQVFAKGIMEEQTKGLFGVDECITCSQAQETIRRIADKSFRRVPKRSDVPGKVRFLQEGEAQRMLGEDRRILLVDVRSRKDYAQGHRQGSVNVPLKDLALNPRMICADTQAVIFLYCARGYQSALAAGLLVDAGYKNVSVIPGLQEAEGEYGGIS